MGTGERGGRAWRGTVEGGVAIICTVLYVRLNSYRMVPAANSFSTGTNDIYRDRYFRRDKSHLAKIVGQLHRLSFSIEIQYVYLT